MGTRGPCADVSSQSPATVPAELCVSPLWDHGLIILPEFQQKPPLLIKRHECHSGCCWDCEPRDPHQLLKETSASSEEARAGLVSGCLTEYFDRKLLTSRSEGTRPDATPGSGERKMYSELMRLFQEIAPFRRLRDAITVHCETT
ncbi:hypothetical protein AAFF_G00408180 [Aldrovandia affinis]|uniref:Uncharacterized protein n=1 Tax=Aldrovandia affinis TaxID=143900 RepID=A0AAD7SCC9_9TELE|nr:hypothetical protein AAFF_G00408180 [Aldrovandia affinis]